MSQVQMDREARVPRYWPKSCRERECVPTDMVYNNSFYDPPNISPIAPKRWHVKILYNDVRAHRYREAFWGCGSPMVKVSDHGRHVLSSSRIPLKTRRVGQRCTLNLSRAETSSRWCGS
ncbi:uncharacterized protein TNCV_3768761 [Trichonephila clavipes]|nr:uncharacterized protein TNCV_3768761 [Trichonephila clavipes]